MTEQLQQITKAFRLPGKVVGYTKLTNGNINSTYRIDMDDNGEQKSYVAQKINTFVFKKPEEMMHNIDLVTTHIRSHNPKQVSLNFYHTDEDKSFFYDAEGSFWRIMNYVDSITLNSCTDPTLIRATGSGFGKFQNQLADLDGSQLFETIPNFHNTRKRFENLEAAIARDAAGRVKSVQKEIAAVLALKDHACILCDRFANGDFPVRVTHNDTKSNNILFDKNTMKPLVVIDLDTVMPGMAMYDFGDAVRFLCNDSAEDEADLSLVHCNVEKFRCFAEGFIGEVRRSLTKDEIDSLVLGAFSATAELAARFLEDYLNGDVYFKTLSPEHNIVRTRCQTRLSEDILSKEQELNDIVQTIAKKPGKKCTKK